MMQLRWDETKRDWIDVPEPPLYDSKEYWQSTAVTAFRMLLEEYGRRKEAQDQLKALEAQTPLREAYAQHRLALDEALTERAQLQVDVNELEGLLATHKKMSDEYETRIEVLRDMHEVQRKQLVELRASQCKCDD